MLLGGLTVCSIGAAGSPESGQFAEITHWVD
jgi:hypothetical protein